MTGPRNCRKSIETFSNSDESPWSLFALCRAHPEPELWFPEIGIGQDVDVAKSICQQCPVRGECLQHAMGWPEKFGIWGGLTTRERDCKRRNMITGSIK